MARAVTEHGRLFDDVAEAYDRFRRDARHRAGRRPADLSTTSTAA
jgi:hypothetical protein